MRIIGVTLTRSRTPSRGTPFEGYYTTAKRSAVAVNDWDPPGGAFDNVIDFDAGRGAIPQHPAAELDLTTKGITCTQRGATQTMAESVDSDC